MVQQLYYLQKVSLFLLHCKCNRSILNAQVGTWASHTYVKVTFVGSKRLTNRFFLKKIFQSTRKGVFSCIPPFRKPGTYSCLTLNFPAKR